MPSSNGVYTLPLGYLAVTGSTILASQHNPPLEDIAAALTGRLSRDGSAPMTGAVQFVSGTATLPGAVFAADASSGFYKTTTGIGVSIGGTKVAEFLPGGVKGARVLGELVPYTMRAAAPALFVYPVGQTLSRITYADLWAIVQNEIASGNTLYNNGDGSTTFGIPDMRGRVLAAADPTGTLLTSFSMTPDGNTLGAKGGTQASVLGTSNLPPYTPSGSIFNFSVSGTVPMTVTSGFQGGSGGIGFTTGGTTAITASGSASFAGNAQGGTSVAFSNVQPTILCNYILFAGA